MDEGFLSIISASCGQLVKMFLTIELHGVFGSNFADLFIPTFSSHWYVNSDKALPSVILAGRGLLV